MLGQRQGRRERRPVDQRHQHVRGLMDQRPRRTGDHVLVAEHDAQPRPLVPGEHAGLGAGRKFVLHRKMTADVRVDNAARNVFAERHQMPLVVAAEDGLGRVDQDCGLVERARILGMPRVDLAAEEQWAGGLLQRPSATMGATGSSVRQRRIRE